MKNALGSMLQQAQKMQENINKARAEIAAMEVTGESGAGLVKIVMNGEREARKVTIDPSLVAEDKDMLEDMVAAAINDAVHKVARLKKDRMAEVTAGLPLPPGFDLPF